MTLRRALLLALVVLLLAPAPALAAGGQMPLAGADILSAIGGVFGSIASAVPGAFTWTIGLATNFILTTIAALVHMLIPHSWVNKGLQIMEWIVAAPDYAGRITTPAGTQAYGFAGINALRDLFCWLGVAIAPLTLTYATSRAMLGQSEPVAIPLLRVLATAAVIVSYPYWWAQAAAVCDQVTHQILTVPDVSRGLCKLMDYAVDGVALGGWQLIDLGLMGATALCLLGLIFFKIVLILVGALLYATGPLMIGLVATESGGALARAWLSAVSMLFGLGVAWATLFAVGAVLIGDAGSAGPLVAGNSAFGGLVGGLLLAVSGLASLWLCLKAGREAVGLLRMQLAGLLILSRHTTTVGNTTAASASASRTRTTSQSLRDYRARLSRATSAAAGELARAGAGGAAIASSARAAGYAGRRGLLGTAAAAVRAGAVRGAPGGEALLSRSRAGAVAARIARAGTAGWQSHPAVGQTQTHAKPTPAPTPAPATAARQASSGAAAGASTTTTTRQPQDKAPATGHTVTPTSTRQDEDRTQPPKPAIRSSRAGAGPAAGGARSPSDGARPAPAVPDRVGDRAVREPGAPPPHSTPRPSTPPPSSSAAPSSAPAPPTAGSRLSGWRAPRVWRGRRPPKDGGR